MNRQRKCPVVNLWSYVAVYEAVFNSKRLTSSLVQALCFPEGVQLDYT